MKIKQQMTIVALVAFVFASLNTLNAQTCQIAGIAKIGGLGGKIRCQDGGTATASWQWPGSPAGTVAVPSLVPNDNTLPEYRITNPGMNQQCMATGKLTFIPRDIEGLSEKYRLLVRWFAYDSEHGVMLTNAISDVLTINNPTPRTITIHTPTVECYVNVKVGDNPACTVPQFNVPIVTSGLPVGARIKVLARAAWDLSGPAVELGTITDCGGFKPLQPIGVQAGLYYMTAAYINEFGVTGPESPRASVVFEQPVYETSVSPLLIEQPK